MKTHHLLFLICLLILEASCHDELETSKPTELVIEGWIEEGGFPIVSVGQTFSASGDFSYDINDYIIKWAKVTVSDGHQSIILTGSYDKERFPPYKYTTYDMRGIAGRTYTLEVEYKEMHAFASTSIPKRVAIDSLKPVKLHNDTLYYINAYFNDFIEKGDYFTIFSKRAGKDKDFLLSYMGCIDDSLSTTAIKAEVFRGNSITSELDSTASRYYAPGDNVTVCLRHVDASSHRFWKSFMNQNNMSSNMFFPYTSNLESNIIGGKGYWCGSGSSYKSITIPE